MSNPSKAKGTAWESAIVSFLREHGWPYVERRALAGGKDRGDIAGVVGVVIEAKNTKTLALGTFLDEANTEAANDGADFGVAWMKRRGKSWPGHGYVLMDGSTFVGLLVEAGYGPNTIGGPVPPLPERTAVPGEPLPPLPDSAYPVGAVALDAAS